MAFLKGVGGALLVLGISMLIQVKAAIVLHNTLQIVLESEEQEKYSTLQLPQPLNPDTNPHRVKNNQSYSDPGPRAPGGGGGISPNESLLIRAHTRAANITSWFFFLTRFTFQQTYITHYKSTTQLLCHKNVRNHQ